MATSLPTTETEVPVPARRSIAPVWHTLLLVAVLIGFSALGANNQDRVAHRAGRIPFYLTTMAWEYLMVAYVAWGLKRGGKLKFGDMVGGRWKQPEDALLDVAVAVGFQIAFYTLLAIGAAILLKTGVMHQPNTSELKKQLDFIVPRTGAETALWLLVSATAGFCEEIIFRGYFQRQCASISGKIWLGILMQGLVFGLSHGYEGVGRMAVIACYGVMFGILAWWRKSLRPGMMAHTAQDIISGIGLRFIS